MAKRIMHKFKMTEISSVDKPAQAGAKMVLMKRDSEDLAKMMFDQALEQMELVEQVYELIEDQWELNDALQSSIYSIVADKETYPDPVSAVKESLTQFASAVVNLVSETEENIDDETMKREIGKRAWLMANPEDRKNSTQKSEEGKMPESTKTVESLANDLAKVNAELQIAKAYSALNDAEKAHYNSLSAEAQGDFLGMTREQRSSELSKSEGSNPVVYTALDGMEFRKNDDPRFIAMAKRADENEKIAKQNLEKAQALEIAKRVADEIPNIPGDQEVKIALYKAVDGIKDEAIRKSCFSVLKSHNALAEAITETRGTKDGVIRKAEDELEAKAKEYQKANNILSYEKAYAAFLDTPEGQKLYERSLSTVSE